MGTVTIVVVIMFILVMGAGGVQFGFVVGVGVRGGR
jgi:hypothetical protein